MALDSCFTIHNFNSPLKRGVPTRFCRYNLAWRTLISQCNCSGFFVGVLNIFIVGATRYFPSSPLTFVIPKMSIVDFKLRVLIGAASLMCGFTPPRSSSSTLSVLLSKIL